MVDQIIRPSALPNRASPNPSEKIPVDNGSTVGGATVESIVLAGRPTASQAEAEAGVDAVKAMTPLTTKQAVTARIGVDIATIAQGNKADTAVQSVQGTPGNISVNNADPLNPIVSYVGSGVSDGDKTDVVVTGSGSVWKVKNKTMPTVAAAIADAPAADPDYYIVAFYDTNFATTSGAKYRKTVGPAGTGKFQNANGTWYIINEAVVTPQMMGYVTGNVGPFVSLAFDVSPHVMLPPFNGYTATTSVSKTMTRDFKFNGNLQLVLFDHQIVWQINGQQIISTGSYLFSSSRQRYSENVLVNAIPGVQAGDIFFVNNASQVPLSGWSDTKKECILIRGVTGSNQLDLAAGLNFNWNLVDEQNLVEIWRPVAAEFIDINFRIRNPVNNQAHYMLHLIGLRDIKIVRPRLTAPIAGFDRANQFHRIGIQIWKCWNWTVTDAYYEGLAYPLGVYGGTRNGMEINSNAFYCRHGHADLGDFASDYHLVGIHGDSCYETLSTHPCFRAYATNFTAANDMEINNWRCIGGGISNGIIQETSLNTGSSPQFQSEVPTAGFEYLYSDADFYATNVNFLSQNRTSTNPPFFVRYGRHVHIDGITVPAIAAFTTWTSILLLSVGNGVVSTTGTAFRGPGKYLNGVAQ